MVNAAQIEQELIQQKGLAEKEYAFYPASKYAYYNPAKKDKTTFKLIHPTGKL